MELSILDPKVQTFEEFLECERPSLSKTFSRFISFSQSGNRYKIYVKIVSEVEGLHELWAISHLSFYVLISHQFQNTRKSFSKQTTKIASFKLKAHLNSESVFIKALFNLFHSREQCHQTISVFIDSFHHFDFFSVAVLLSYVFA